MSIFLWSSSIFVSLCPLLGVQCPFQGLTSCSVYGVSFSCLGANVLLFGVLRFPFCGVWSLQFWRLMSSMSCLLFFLWSEVWLYGVSCLGTFFVFWVWCSPIWGIHVFKSLMSLSGSGVLYSGYGILLFGVRCLHSPFWASGVHYGGLMSSLLGSCRDCSVMYITSGWEVGKLFTQNSKAHLKDNTAGLFI